jgi:large subunit ribosomal protein L25
MKTAFELDAEFRDAQGKGASRRLRRADKVPAILYGGHREPRALAIDHTKLMLMLDNERFYSTIINLRVGDLEQAAILKDVQRHPAKNAVVHVDLQRVLEDEKIRITVPLHFKNQGAAPGVKAGGVVSHLRNDVEVSCLPKDLPEYVDVDLGSLEINQMLYLSDLNVPEGVELIELAHGRNVPVVSVHHARAEEVEAPPAEAGAVAAGATGATAAAGAAPVAGAAAPAPAADAKAGAEAKGKDAKK